MKVCTFLDGSLIHGKEVAFWLFSAQAKRVPPFSVFSFAGRFQLALTLGCVGGRTDGRGVFVRVGM